MPTGRHPLLEPYPPLGLPRFDAIDAARFEPAFEEAMREHRAEVEAIAANAAAPDFDNTLAAFDRAGDALYRLWALFDNLGNSASTPALQAVERAMAGPLAAHETAVLQHAGLFARIDALHARRDALQLDAEQRRLLDRVHLQFVRAGARLADADRARYAQVVRRLAELCTQFSQNLLADENAWMLPLRDPADRAGLPLFLLAAARQAGAERSVDAPVVTLSRSLIEPFLAHSTRRDLRETAWRAWVTRGEHDGPTDNRPVIREILALRREQAALLGRDCFADHALADSMAGSRAAVQQLLDAVWQPALAAAERERQALRAAMQAAGADHPLQAWDWRFYAERVRREHYALDDGEIKPYFALERVTQAAFDCAQRLFGIVFVERPDLQAYHPDVRVYEVRNADGSARGLFLHDNFARTGKRSGAWMSELRGQHRNGGTSLPIVLNNNNFAKAEPGQPTLLSHDDARTLFHEFGHGLHGLLSDVRFRTLAGTSVLRDFVELPSQLYEHWLDEPEVLERHARHHATGEPIPHALVEKLRAAQRFGKGYETVSYVTSALVDVALHARADEGGIDISAFERDELRRIGAPDDIGPRHRLPHFGHLFAGDGYAAGYYVYLWAEVLEADAYAAFAEAGSPFDPDTAQRLRDHVYAVGGSVDPGETYRAFRGRDARIEPMLRQRGLLPD